MREPPAPNLFDRRPPPRAPTANSDYHNKHQGSQCEMMEMSTPPKLDVNLNPTVSMLSPVPDSSPTSPSLLDNENLKRQSTGLTAFNDYVVSRLLLRLRKDHVTNDVGGFDGLSNI